MNAGAEKQKKNTEAETSLFEIFSRIIYKRTITTTTTDYLYNKKIPSLFSPFLLFYTFFVSIALCGQFVDTAF